MKNKKLILLTSVMILLPVLAGLLLWERLPEQVPIHWNAAGEVDGWASRLTAVVGFPAFLVGIHLTGILVTNMDKKNQNQNPRVMQLMLWVCPLISALCACLVYSTALGYEIAVERVMPVVMGIFFAIIGNYLPKCTQNSTIGIKLPWTLNNEENWNKTHRLAGKVWVIGGVVLASAGFFSGIAGLFIALAVMVLIPVGYSWNLSRKNGAD